MYWLLIGLLVLALILFLMVRSGSDTVENFITVDPGTLKAQRQQLQFEGERRYNDLGRLEAPGSALSPDLVDAAISQPLAKPSKNVASLLTLVNSSLGLGGGKTASRGTGVEQTGAVMEKIKFCESLPVNCSMLDDPRMAECGFCHRDGVSSTGKQQYRGGMYISADDIIRANEAAEGGTASYSPSIGTCSPRNFTLMRDNCTIRESQLECLRQSVPTDGSKCGQCFGASTGGSSGMIFMGPQPRTFTAWLWVSHPGMHNYNGTGMIITMPDGSTINAASSSQPLFKPEGFYLNNVKEGDTISIKVFGLPMVWCAWLSSLDGKRAIGIDIGLQNETDNPGMVIAGDKRSSAIQKAIAKVKDREDWSGFMNQVPNTVLWYARRDEIMEGGIVRAVYGTASSNVDVTDAMKSLAGAYTDITVNSDTFGVVDPAPGQQKNLTISLDNGQRLNAFDGQVIPKQRLNNSANLRVVIPATLTDPVFPDDKADCPTGPIITTQQGAALMGSHSCFKADGSFNPSVFCLKELFVAAGGNSTGSLYPDTPEKAAALVINNSLDDTVAMLDLSGSIALYEQRTDGTPATFKEYKDASMQMLGRRPTNPCDAATPGLPLSTECLDYIYRVANMSATSMPSGSSVDPDSLPYSGCSKGAPVAPLKADGSVNDAYSSSINQLTSVDQAFNMYKEIHTLAHTAPNFEQQNSAMQACHGVLAKPPPPPPFTCVPEVFNICPPDPTTGSGYSLTPDEAAATCKAAGARLATPDEIADAQKLGANWCACGWTTDGTAQYPMNKVIPEYGYGCGDPNKMDVRNCGNMMGWWANGKACATCFGVKPKQGSSPPGVLPFNTDTQTAAYRKTSPGYDETDGAGQICFNNLSVDEAQKKCSANPDCKSFSFAAGVERGGGCFKMNHVGYNPNPAYVGYTKMPAPPAPITWNAPQIPQIGQLMSAKTGGGLLLRHGGFKLWATSPDGMTPVDSTFKVIPALNGQGGYVSFQSVNYSTQYIYAKADSRAGIQVDDSGGANTSFAVVPALNNKPNMYSLRSYSHPDYYLTVRSGTSEVWMMIPGADTDAASWAPAPPQNGQLNVA